MYSSVLTGSTYGITPYQIQVETDVSRGLPGFEIVGCPAGGVKEARERIKVALKNTGISLPPLKITVNLSPADIRKEGTAFDLPIAAGILTAMGVLKADMLSCTFIIGELGLDGEVKGVKGILPLVLMAQKEGFQRCILPKENAPEGALAEGIDIVGVKDLKEFLEYLQASKEEQAGWCGKEPAAIRICETEPSLDFSDVQGQECVKRAAEIAAAGFHHLLIMGPPGVGKTMIAQRIPDILPPMTVEESIEVSKIYSVAGLLKEQSPFIQKRPFLKPHHTISAQALAGGGRAPRPGVISLAHKGILFLDELPEFSRATIEVLRQPLEEKEIQITRMQGTVTYPADCMLIAAMNPCPCGYFPDRNKCSCTESQIRRYAGHISGPILDRMDLCTQAQIPDISRMEESKAGESSRVIRERVLLARKLQQERFAQVPYEFNSQIPAGEILHFCGVSGEEREFMERAYRNLKLSIRAYHRILRVARTIADLEESSEIKIQHLSEAMCFRMPENRFGRMEA